MLPRFWSCLQPKEVLWLAVEWWQPRQPRSQHSACRHPWLPVNQSVGKFAWRYSQSSTQRCPLYNRHSNLKELLRLISGSDSRSRELTDSSLLSPLYQVTNNFLINNNTTVFNTWMAVKPTEVWELRQEENIRLGHYWFVVGSLMGNYYFQ